MRDMHEMDKLEKYLKDNSFIYERKPKFDGEILIVYDENGKTLWDVVCHQFSYGEEIGLLEGCGEIVDWYDPKEDYFSDVEGYLYAETVIDRLKKKSATSTAHNM